MSNPRLQVDIGVNLKEFNQGMKDLTNRLKSVGDRLTSVGSTLSTRLTLPLVAAGGAAIKLASDFEESLNKVNVAFGTSAGEVRKFSETTLDSFGIAQGTALDMAALFGDMGTAMGLPTDAAAKMSTELVGLAGDLASFKNQRIDIVQTALAGIFTGETESLKQLGIVMTQANLQAFALSRGIQKNIQDMTQAEQVNLRFAYVLNNTTNAQGDFARTSEGAANQMRIFQESLKELGQQFGAVMLPMFTDVVKKANDLVKAFSGLSDTNKQLVINAGAFLAVLGPITIFIGTLATNIARLMSVAPKLAKWLFGVSGGATAAGAALVGLSADAISTANSVEQFRDTIKKTLETMGEGMGIEEVNALIDQQIQKISDLENNFRGTTAAAVEAHQGQIRAAKETLNYLIKIRDSKWAEQMKRGAEESTVSVKELNRQLNEVSKPRVIQIIKDPEIMYEGLGLMEAFYKVQQAAKKNGFEVGDMLPPDLIMGLDDIVANFEQMGKQIGEKLPEQMSKLNEISQMFVEGLAAGIAEIIIQGGNLGDMFKEIGKQLLKSGLTKLLTALLTGGIGTGAGFFGKGGGLLGSILPKIFGAEAMSAGAMTPALTGQNITVGGQFVLKGTDLAASIIRTNKSTLR